MKRTTLREWIPPIFWNWLRRRGSGVRVADQWRESAELSWPAAAAKAARGYSEGVLRMTQARALSFLAEEEPKGWFQDDLQFHARMIQFCTVVARVSMGRSVVNILDFGGGFGVHALAIRRLFPLISYNYTVCELPEFCEIGRTLNNDVQFISSLTHANSDYQLVSASGSVQYLHDWQNLLSELCRVSTAAVFITRTPFVFNVPSFITNQRAYDTEYPGWVFNYHEFVQAAASQGLILKEVFVNGRGIAVWGAREANVHLGLLFEKRDAC